MKVCIDIGHCPSAPGAENSHYGMSEYRFWKSYAQLLVNYLNGYGHGAVIVNRETEGGGTGMTACVCIKCIISYSCNGILLTS